MTVDGTYTEKWKTTGTFSMLSSSKVFIGGSKEPYSLPGTSTKNNFAGCLRKVWVFSTQYSQHFLCIETIFFFNTQVEYKAEGLYLPLLQLAKDGHHLITVIGSITFQCSPVEQIEPVTFTTSSSHLVRILLQ